MPRTKRSLLVPVSLVVIPTCLAFAWGLSWAAGGFQECGEGTYFLADLGWVLGGLLLGLIVGIVVPVILVSRGSFLLAIPVVLAAGMGMFLAGEAGATIAPPLVGCTAWDTRGAGSMTGLGLAIGAVPTILIAGIAVAIRGTVRHRPQSGDDADPSLGPTDSRDRPRHARRVDPSPASHLPRAIRVRRRGTRR
jgi:hypothetical protein